MAMYVLREECGATTIYSDSVQCLIDAKNKGCRNIATRTDDGKETTISTESLERQTGSEEGWNHPVYLFYFNKSRFL